ncbi:MAG: hypothetical protein CVV64_11445 [Candidatus Wallbacteria bacterium HGW-Wallbacteria-1]|jgi:hypothetical protein|uniref:Uncharacterized protein n=1 Tax=Candidatus Wallbacteria bacterium HGW-Wallbacteria-1 TaxID=2013854 RepID=A0A2N1PNL5_9BACT|nr:MAG: hypothetical protein CVV64_11445 [Candidatus Wallbacteria bacterium HGW-Wallbacteria-1]
MKHTPEYNIEDFIAASGCPNSVIVFKNAQTGARDVFKLTSSARILGFIHNRGLEDLKFKNSKIWEKNPKPEIEIFVDAYRFASNGILGYLAFFFSKHTKKWIIKSFKQNTESNTVLADAYQEAMKNLV